MPQGLRRFQQSRQSHFVTFSCRDRRPLFASPELFDHFVRTLEEMRRRFQLRIYGYVVMPEHVHLLVSEPPIAALDEAIHFLKLSFAKGTPNLRSAGPVQSQVSAQKPRANLGPPSSNNFWQKRYYDRNVRNYREFTIKLRYLHRNPVKRGLVKEPAEWKWSSFRHYALREIGVVEIESGWTAQDREVGAEWRVGAPGSRPDVGR